MRNKINIEALFSVLLLDGIAILLLVALISGKIHSYVHPRLDIWLWLSIPALLLVSFSILPRIIRPRRKANLLVYGVVLLPLLTAFFLPAASITSSRVQLTGTDTRPTSDLGTTQTTAETKTPDSNSVYVTVTPSPAETSAQINKTSSPTPISTQTTEKNTESSFSIEKNMVIDDDQYADWLVSVNADMTKYDGVTVTFKGQVIRDTGFTSKEFVPARMSMWCCAADVMPYGFLCRYDNAANLSDNEWVLVTAVIHIEDYDGKKMPILYASSVEATDAPNNIYIYFNP